MSLNESFRLEWTATEPRVALLKENKSNVLVRSYRSQNAAHIADAMVSDRGAVVLFTTDGKASLYDNLGDRVHTIERWKGDFPYLPSRGVSPPSTDFDFFCWTAHGEAESMVFKLFGQTAQRIDVATGVARQVDRDELAKAVLNTLHSGDVELARLRQAGFDAGGLIPAAYLAATIDLTQAINRLKAIAVELDDSSFFPGATVQPRLQGRYVGLLWSPLRVVVMLAISSLGDKAKITAVLVESKFEESTLYCRVTPNSIPQANAITLLNIDESSCVSLLGPPTFKTERKWWYENEGQPITVTFGESQKITEVSCWSSGTRIARIGLEQIPLQSSR